MRVYAVQKYTNLTKAVVKERLVNFCRHLDKTPPGDVFQPMAKIIVSEKNAKPIQTKSIMGLRQLLLDPKMEERGIELSEDTELVLKMKSLIPSFEKVLKAKNGKFDNFDVNWIAESLTPENSKFLDIVLDPTAATKSTKWYKLKADKIAKLLTSLARIEKPRLVEILSDKRLNFKEVLKTIENEEKVLGLKTIKNPQLKKIAENAFDGKNDFYPEVYSVCSDIGFKIQNIDDLKIKEHVNKELALLETQRGDIVQEKLCSVETLLDAYHMAKGHYGFNGGEVGSYYSSLSELSPLDHKRLKKVFTADGFQSAKKALKRVNKDFLVDFKKEGKLEGLKQYIVENKDIEPKMADYMYEKYYLSTLKPQAKQEHLKILDEFGTKLFYVNNPKAPTLVYEELSRWKKAGGDDFIAPPLLDLTRVKENYLDGIEGFQYPAEKHITLKGDGDSSIIESFRHELTHGNDKLPDTDDVVINGIDFRKIQKSEKYRPEFVNAGLDDGLIDYAHTDKFEFVAVASEGDYSRYSDKFKKVLVKLGMPEWVFKMEVIRPSVLKRAEEVAQKKALEQAAGKH